MTDGIKKLRKVQLGKETTAGTAVDASTILRVDSALLESTPEVIFPAEDVGLLTPTDRNYIPKLLAKMSIGDNPATFEQLPYIFEAGIKKVGSGATDTGGSGKVYVYPLPTTTPAVTQTYTVEGGDNTQAEEMEYAFVESFKLSGKPKEAVNFSAEWAGRRTTPTTFTAALSIPTVEEILFGMSKLYIDNPGGTGGTLVSGTLLGFELDITTGLKPVFSGDGEIFFNRTKQVGPSGSLQITFEHNASAVAEKAAWLAKTTRAIRLLIEGSNLTTAGTYSKKSLIVDVWGRWSKFDKLAELDGNDIIAGTLTLGYSATDAQMGRITVVNELASLP